MKTAPTVKKTTKKTSIAPKGAHKVDIHPNRMTLAVSALAAVSLVLFALMVIS